MMDIIENSGISSTEQHRKSNGTKQESKEGKQIGQLRSSGKNCEHSG